MLAGNSKSSTKRLPENPIPFQFGLESITHPVLINRLLEYEEQLSKGTLRDIVYLTNRMRALIREPEEPTQQKIVDEVILWLDTLPEIQREILAMKILNWLPIIYHDKHRLYHLHYECLQRRPINYISKDLQKNLNFNNYPFTQPGYKAYLEQRGITKTTPEEPQPLD